MTVELHIAVHLWNAVDVADNDDVHSHVPTFDNIDRIDAVEQRASWIARKWYAGIAVAVVVEPQQNVVLACLSFVNLPLEIAELLWLLLVHLTHSLFSLTPP